MGHDRSPRRRTLRDTALSLTALAVLSQAVAACSNNPLTSPGRSSATTIASQPSASTAAARTYKAIPDACDVLDQALLTATLGPDGGDLGTPRSDNNSLAEIARCQHTYGAPGARSLGAIEVMTVKTGGAQAYYDGIRGAQQKTDTLTEIPGLGQGAYRFTDTQTGPHIVVNDANLYLTISISGQNATAPETVSVADVLAKLAQHAMIALLV
ncbi:hypothetical protein [Paractinoplanes toevensis]|uniref:DUF3558 domain-containing protein n=1 Tax=Paractinoplanes toevensis TaxID=571911 RepID=A0A919W488_9ACTN|nr:hypothetical protein [Actinoplanes toevensis]GIM89823.1 hypothetical protein Ato02nite_016160 [Actinoplanes toevensis]